MPTTAERFTQRLAGINDAEPAPKVCVSFGMGLDSSVMVTLHCCRRGP